MDGIREASAFSDAAVREAAYACIREEIASCCDENFIRTCKRRHNELSLISRLPPEILTNVFQHTMTPLGWSTSPRDFNTIDISWIQRVSHVCSHWRRVALNCPSLWSDIPFHYPAWATEMLARSKTASLIIGVKFGTNIAGLPRQLVSYSTAPLVRDALKELLPVRVRKLYLSRIRSERKFSRELVSLLDSPAPILEAFDIHFATPKDDNKLPENLFAMQSPRLTRLHVSSCGLNWQSSILPNLRSLEVTLIPIALRPSGDQVISALSNMPCLENLVLHSVFAPPSVVATTFSTTANLPRLVSFNAECRLSNCVLLFDHITYPNTAHVHVTCDIAEFDKHTCDFALFQILAGNLGRRMQIPIRCLKIHEQRVELHGSSKALGPAQLTFCVTPRYGPLRFNAKIITNILQSLQPLQEVKSLTVDGVALDKMAWIKYFGHLGRVKQLHVAFDYNGFLDALATSTSTAFGQPDHAESPPFKALRTLTVDNWIFDQVYDRRRPKMSCLERLEDALRTRQKEGLELAKLVIEECRQVQYSDVAALEKLVKEVEWDGEQNLAEDEEQFSEDSFEAYYSSS